MRTQTVATTTAAALAAVALCVSCLLLMILGPIDCVLADDDVDESDVLVLTKDSFDSVVSREELMLVEFYAPWCGHCKHLKPAYAAAASALKKNTPPIKLAKVDATAETELAGRFDVHGYPTLLVMRSGRKQEYKGPRDVDGIVDYMKKQVGPAAKPLGSKEAFEEFTALGAKRDFVVVGFLPDKTSQIYSAFLLVAGRLRDDFLFGVITDADVAKECGHAEEGVIAFKDYDDKRTEYSGKTKSKELEAWVLQQSFPLVGEFKASKMPMYEKRGLPLAKYYMRIDWSAANAKHTKFYVTRLQQAALEYLGKMLFTIVDATTFSHDLDMLGWKDKHLEKAWEGGLIVEKKGRKFKFDGKFNAVNVKKFCSQVLSGEAEPFVKSEPVPETNDEPVKVVVGKTFNSIVEDPDKDVMIELYAPWCGHCKALAPKYEKLAKKLASSDGVVVAKMDATANDAPPEYEVQGYPSLFFKPAGAKSPLKYEGDREVEAMFKFIKQNAKNPISGGKKSKKKDL